MNTDTTTGPVANEEPVPAHLSHASTVLYPAIDAAMKDLQAVPAGSNPAVDRAFNALHAAFWSECPAPASAPSLRPVA